MPHPIREFLPERYYFLTNRATHSMLLFRPDEEVEAIVAERLLAAADRYRIEIYGFICMGNHWHAAVRAPKGNMEKFLRDFEGAVARDLNAKWGRDGGFFARRATATQIRDEASLLAMVLYMLANPAAADLVETVDDWPGLSSAPELLHNKTRTFQIFRRRDWHAAGRPKDQSRFIRDVPFAHAILPMFAHLSPEERAAKIAKLLAVKERAHADRRARERKRVLGRKRIMKANWWDRPCETDRSPRPLCHASTREGLDAYRRHRKRFLAAFRSASKRFRAGEFDVKFPRGSFRPPIMEAG